jgi:hypothetical protein
LLPYTLNQGAHRGVKDRGGTWQRHMAETLQQGGETEESAVTGQRSTNIFTAHVLPHSHRPQRA